MNDLSDFQVTGRPNKHFPEERRKSEDEQAVRITAIFYLLYCYSHPFSLRSAYNQRVHYVVRSLCVIARRNV